MDSSCLEATHECFTHFSFDRVTTPGSGIHGFIFNLKTLKHRTVNDLFLQKYNRSCMFLSWYPFFLSFLLTETWLYFGWVMFQWKGYIFWSSLWLSSGQVDLINILVKLQKQKRVCLIFPSLQLLALDTVLMVGASAATLDYLVVFMVGDMGYKGQTKYREKAGVLVTSQPQYNTLEMLCARGNKIAYYLNDSYFSSLLAAQYISWCNQYQQAARSSPYPIALISQLLCLLLS